MQLPFALALLTLALLTPALLTPALAPAPARAQGLADPLQTQKQQLEQVESERDQMQRQMAGFKVSEQETLQEIASLSDAIKASRRRALDLERDLAKTTAEQARQDAELSELNGRMEGSRTRMAVRLKRLYRMTKTERSATLFQLARYRSFARDATLLGRVQAQDQAAVRQFEGLQRDLSAKTAELHATVERLSSLHGDLDAERTQLAEREAGLKDSLKGLKRNQQLYAKYLTDLDGMQNTMQDAVVKLEQSRGSAQRASGDPTALRGRLRIPIAGAKLLERFGAEGHSVKRFQRGIVLGAAEGAAVQAAAAGSIVHAGPFRGYEELVVLDHGKGLFTVYGHLERLEVVKGAWVEAGARLGTVTWQPEDGRPELYFEVRFDGKPEDPQQWLEQPAK
jgi:septal ring factor EnvC (AmiA/AmiB activator)